MDKSLVKSSNLIKGKTIESSFNNDFTVNKVTITREIDWYNTELGFNGFSRRIVHRQDYYLDIYFQTTNINIFRYIATLEEIVLNSGIRLIPLADDFMTITHRFETQEHHIRFAMLGKITREALEDLRYIFDNVNNINKLDIEQMQRQICG